MILNAKNGTLQMNDAEMDYISFGHGSKILILIPGVGDGLMTVKGKAIPFAFLYRKYAKDYTVYVFSRRNRLPKEYSTKDMAADQAEAMKILGIPKASIMGVSQGGMIAQHLAIDYPELVDKLVLVATLSTANETVRKVLNNWVAMAQDGNYKGIMVDTMKKSYSDRYVKHHRILFPLLGLVGKPASFERFLTQVNSCSTHDAHDRLDKILVPTLIVGGSNDKIVDSASFPKIAEKIKNSTLLIYEGLGHAVYDEAKDFNSKVMDFLSSDAG